MTMKRYLQAVSGAVIVSLSAACSSLYDSHSNVAQVHNPIKMNEVVFVDHELNRVESEKFFGVKTHERQVIKVSVQSKGIKSSPTGTAEVWAVLRNHTDYPQQVEARTMFFDGTQAPVDAAPQWQRLYIPANSIATYKELSISQNVAHYRIEIKGAK